MLKPLHDRVLIKPHQNPNETESGLILPEHRADRYAEMQGTVIAVGTPKHPRKHEAEALADEVSTYALYRNADPYVQSDVCADVSKMLRDLVRREPCVQPGDDVLFSWAVGQEITIDDERYLLLREDDLLAVLETA